MPSLAVSLVPHSTSLRSVGSSESEGVPIGHGIDFYAALRSASRRSFRKALFRFPCLTPHGSLSSTPLVRRLQITTQITVHTLHADSVGDRVRVIPLALPQRGTNGPGPVSWRHAHLEALCPRSRVDTRCCGIGAAPPFSAPRKHASARRSRASPGALWRGSALRRNTQASFASRYSVHSSSVHPLEMLGSSMPFTSTVGVTWMPFLRPCFVYHFTS
jgi:hypothetical protein